MGIGNSKNQTQGKASMIYDPRNTRHQTAHLSEQPSGEVDRDFARGVRRGRELGDGDRVALVGRLPVVHLHTREVSCESESE